MKDNKVLHRNLSLRSILLTKDGTIKIASFSNAKILENYGELAYDICGNPTTVAPEIIEGKGCTFSADIWSLGRIFYELLENYFPFMSYSNE